MNSTLNPGSSTPQEKKMLEEFFNDFPAEKAERLLWRWLLAGMENDFSNLSQEDLREFSEFFERLHQLEQQCLQTQKSEGGQE